MRVGSFMYFVMLYKFKRTNKMGGLSAGLKKVLGVSTNIFSSFICDSLAIFNLR